MSLNFSFTLPQQRQQAPFGFGGGAYSSGWNNQQQNSYFQPSFSRSYGGWAPQQSYNAPKYSAPQFSWGSQQNSGYSSQPSWQAPFRQPPNYGYQQQSPNYGNSWDSS